AESHLTERQLARAPKDETALALLARLVRVDCRNRFDGSGDGTEILVDDFERGCALEVADDDGRRVVRVVEGVVELFEARGRDVLNVRAPADGRVVVRVLAEGCGVDRLVEN